MTEFADLILEKLSPLVGRNCVMPDLPYYLNVGDLLIWEGMEAFLKDNGTECLWRSSISTFKYRPLAKDVTICLVGGGNFGDLWRGLQEFKKKIVRLYPNNKIIVFPQSVYYEEDHLCEEDAAVFAAHKEMYICARDRKSFDYLKEHFPSCNTLLVPDMALYLSFKSTPSNNNRSLFLKRIDRESADYSAFDMSGMEVSDWPTIRKQQSQKYSFFCRIRHKILRINARLGLPLPFYKLAELMPICKIQCRSITMSKKWDIVKSEIEYFLYLNKYKYPGKLSAVIDWFANKYYRPIAIKYSADFLCDYETIYSTRLHGAILAMLLNRQVYMLDNSYGKLSSFYYTWLYCQDNVSFLANLSEGRK